MGPLCRWNAYVKYACSLPLLSKISFKLHCSQIHCTAISVCNKVVCPCNNMSHGSAVPQSNFNISLCAAVDIVALLHSTSEIGLRDYISSQALCPGNAYSVPHMVAAVNYSLAHSILCGFLNRCALPTVQFSSNSVVLTRVL